MAQQAIVDTWPMFGRTGELSRVSALLRTGDSAGVVLAGAPGVGRTRLANELLDEAKAQSYVVTRVTASESAATMALGAFGTLLPPLPPGGSGEDSTSAILSNIQRSVANRAPGGRVALVVDDAHLLDDESAILVHQLATTRTAFIIATMRSGVVAPDPLVALWKDETLLRLDLAPLTPPVVDALLTAVLGGSVDGATRHYLAARTRGNVQLLRELVRAALDSGALRDEGGVWRLVGPLLPSPRLVELVEGVLRPLSPEERAVFETIACGEPLGMAMLADLVDRQHLETLERRGLLTISCEGERRTASITLPVHGDVVRHHIPVVRSDAVRRTVAAAFERCGMRRREDVVRVAGWQLEGGSRIPSDLAVAAAARAVDTGDLDVASRLAEAAVEAGGGFDVLLLAAWLDGLRGQGERAEHRLAGLLPSAVAPAERGLLAITRADNLLRVGRPDDALAVIAAAEAGLGDANLLDELASKRAYVLLRTRRLSEALEIAGRLLVSPTARARAEACAVSAIGQAQAGRVEEALLASAAGEEAATHPAGLPVFWPGWIHAWARCDTLVGAGRLEEAERHAQQAYDAAVAEGCRSAHAAFACSLSSVALAQGRVKTASRWGREGLSLLRGHVGGWALRRTLAGTASAVALSEGPDEAEMLLAEYDSIDVPSTAPLGGDIGHARAWAAARRAQLDTAYTVLRATARGARDAGESAVEARALHDLARLGDAAGAAPRLVELAAYVEGPMIAAQARHVAALVEGDGAELDAASVDFEVMGASLLAAEAAGNAARAWRLSGRARMATVAGRRGALLAGRCEQAVTPGLAEVARGATLTNREREVASLAAGGLSNREITQQLFLSVRTVENQLQRAYAKLGVRSRSELAAALAKP